jgi:hypothetical protein
MKIIFDQMEKSICRIKLKDGGNGTGFFCNIPKIGWNPFRVLITNYHVLEEKDIIEGNAIKLSLNNDKINIVLKIDKTRKKYTNRRFDITIIEIKSND